MKTSFKDEDANAPKWQQKRYSNLLTSLKGLELPEEEKATLLRLCTFAKPLLIIFCQLFKRFKMFDCNKKTPSPLPQ